MNMIGRKKFKNLGFSIPKEAQYILVFVSQGPDDGRTCSLTTSALELIIEEKPYSHRDAAGLSPNFGC
jgi:hypothetical protein